jgi:galactokinase
MYASHRSLRNDYEVSCKELDTVVEIAESIGLKGGMIGCRMTGAGFGGCAVALVKTDAMDAISKKLAEDYKKKTGIEATIFVSRPAGGAMVIKNNGPSSSSVRLSSSEVRMSSCTRVSVAAY